MGLCQSREQQHGAEHDGGCNDNRSQRHNNKATAGDADAAVHASRNVGGDEQRPSPQSGIFRRKSDGGNSPTTAATTKRSFGADDDMTSSSPSTVVLSGIHVIPEATERTSSSEECCCKEEEGGDGSPTVTTGHHDIMGIWSNKNNTTTNGNPSPPSLEQRALFCTPNDTAQDDTMLSATPISSNKTSRSTNSTTPPFSITSALSSLSSSLGGGGPKHHPASADPDEIMIRPGRNSDTPGATSSSSAPSPSKRLAAAAGNKKTTSTPKKKTKKKISPRKKAASSGLVPLGEDTIPEEVDPEAPSDEEDFREDLIRNTPEDEPGRLVPIKIKHSRTTTPGSVWHPPPPVDVDLLNAQHGGCGMSSSSRLEHALNNNNNANVDENWTLAMTGTEHAKSVHPHTMSNFQRLKLQVKLQKRQEKKKARVAKMENRMQEVQEYKDLWRDFQDIQDDVNSLGETTQQQQAASLDRRDSFDLHDTKTWYFDFQSIEFPAGDQDDDNGSQSNLSLLSASSMEAQRLIFAEKRQLRKQRHKNKKNRSSKAAPSGSKDVPSSSSLQGDNESITSPMLMSQQTPHNDYGPIRRTRSTPHLARQASSTSLTDMELAFTPDAAEAAAAAADEASLTRRDDVSLDDDRSWISDLNDDLSYSTATGVAVGGFANNDYRVVRRRRAHSSTAASYDAAAQDNETNTPSNDTEVSATKENAQLGRTDDDDDRAAPTSSPQEPPDPDPGEQTQEPPKKQQQQHSVVAQVTPTVSRNSSPPPPWHCQASDDTRADVLSKSAQGKSESPATVQAGPNKHAVLISPVNDEKLARDPAPPTNDSEEQDLPDAKASHATSRSPNEAAAKVSDPAAPKPDPPEERRRSRTRDHSSHKRGGSNRKRSKTPSSFASPDPRGGGRPHSNRPFIDTMSTEQFLLFSEENALQRVARLEHNGAKRSVDVVELLMDAPEDETDGSSEEIIAENAQDSKNGFVDGAFGDRKVRSGHHSRKISSGSSATRRTGDARDDPSNHGAAVASTAAARKSLLLAEEVAAQVNDVLSKYRCSYGASDGDEGIEVVSSEEDGPANVTLDSSPTM